MSLWRSLAIVVAFVVGIILATMSAQRLLPAGHIYEYYMTAGAITAALVSFIYWVCTDDC